MMELNKDALNKAVRAYDEHDGYSISESVEAAIKTYLTEIMRPGEMLITPPPPLSQPQRDYRKELWIATSASHTGTAVANVEYCNKVVEGFDKFFSEVKQ